MHLIWKWRFLDPFEKFHIILWFFNLLCVVLNRKIVNETDINWITVHSASNCFDWKFHSLELALMPPDKISKRKFNFFLINTFSGNCNHLQQLVTWRHFFFHFSIIAEKKFACIDAKKKQHLSKLRISKWINRQTSYPLLQKSTIYRFALLFWVEVLFLHHNAKKIILF